MTGIQRDSFGYLFIIGLCLFLLVWAIPVYTPEYPGYGAPPALVPIVAVCVMLVMACVSLLRNVIAQRGNKPIAAAELDYPREDGDGGGFTQVGRVNLPHLAGIMVPSVLLLVAIDYIGYVPASLAFLIILQYVIGSRRWLQSITIALTLVAMLYVIMRYGFSVPVPGPQFF